MIHVLLNQDNYVMRTMQLPTRHDDGRIDWDEHQTLTWEYDYMGSFDYFENILGISPSDIPYTIEDLQDWGRARGIILRSLGFRMIRLRDQYLPNALDELFVNILPPIRQFIDGAPPFRIVPQIRSILTRFNFRENDINNIIIGLRQLRDLLYRRICRIGGRGESGGESGGEGDPFKDFDLMPTPPAPAPAPPPAPAPAPPPLDLPPRGVTQLRLGFAGRGALLNWEIGE